MHKVLIVSESEMEMESRERTTYVVVEVGSEHKRWDCDQAESFYFLVN